MKISLVMKSVAKRFQSILSFLCILSLVICFINPDSAHAAFTSSLDSVEDTPPLGNKTPLILIHGVHGKEEGALYWQNFVTFFDEQASTLANKYKLYKFEYDSDDISVHNIGAYLADAISDRAEFASKKIVIVAHSMGGLVARSYMQEHGGAEKIIKLITLATPHHGTPGENDTDQLNFTTVLWHSAFSSIQWLYHFGNIWTDGSLWPLLTSSSYNRTDLKWDGHDNSIMKSSQDLNIWLQNLNNNATADNKIIAYYGYIEPLRQDRQYWEDPDRILFYLPSIILNYNKHERLVITSAAMNAGLNYNFLWNDGMVPYVSASFAGHSNVEVRPPFVDYDHLDMKDGKGSSGLFEQLKNDLLGLPTGDGYPPEPGIVQYGEIYPAGDVDQYSFTVTTPGKYVIYTRGETDTYGALYNGSYVILANDNYDGEQSNFRIEFNITSPGTYYVEVKGGNSSVTGSYMLHIDGPGAGSMADRDDHGFSAWNGTAVDVGSVTAGALDRAGDRDFFKFTAASPGKYVIYTRGETDTYGALYNGSYVILANDNYDGEQSNFRIEFNITSPGTYYVEVKGGNSSVTGSYMLHIDGPGAGSTLYANFTGSGIWKWNGTAWNQVTASAPQDMVVSGSILYGDFGSGGIWKWDGSAWSQVTESNPNMMVVSGSILYGAFGSGGIWKWNGTAWNQVTASAPQDIVVSGSILYGDFGSDGIWKWDGSSWSQVTASDPNMMAVSGSILYGVFGSGGIWKWDGSAWSQVTASVPQNIAVSGSILYGDFGSGGIWKWDDTAWSQVTASDPANMITGS